VKRNLHKSRLIKLFTRARWSQSHTNNGFPTCGSTATDLLMLLFKQYITICGLPLSAASLSHCITCKDICVHQSLLRALTQRF